MLEQLRAGHVFPSLHGNLPGEYFSTHSFKGATIFSTNPRGVAGRHFQTTTDPSNLNMESVQWDKSTYVLPTVLPPAAAPELRSRVLALTLKTLKQRSTWGDNFTKAAPHKQHFQCASAATKACTTASPTKNIIGGAYTFEDPLIKRSTGVVLNVSKDLTENDRHNTK